MKEREDPDFGDEVLKEATLVCVQSIAALYEELPNGRPDQVGSCTYFRYRDQFYLATAAHVLSDRKWRILCVGNREAEAFIPSQDWVFSEKQDIAIVNVTEESDQITLVPLTIDVTKIDKETPLVSFGYPNSQNRVARRYEPSLNRFQKRASSQLTSLVPGFDYAKYDYTDGFHLAVRYPKKDSIRDGRTVNTPKPVGMSGGAIVRPNFPNYADCRLVGILVHWRHDQEALVGTLIEPCIRQVYESQSRS